MVSVTTRKFTEVVSFSRKFCSIQSVLQQTKGHGFPSQSLHPGMWAFILQSSSSSDTRILPSTHSLLTQKHVKFTPTKTNTKKKNYRLLFVTDVCFFLGIFSRHLLIGLYICKYIYITLVCARRKKKRDNHF